MRRLSAFVCVAALLGGLSACAETAEGGADVRLAATLTQYRIDEGTRKLSVGITNVGDATIALDSVTVDWSGFDPLPSRPDRATLPPGEVAGVSLRYGEPQCRRRPHDRPGLVAVVAGSAVRVELERDDRRLLEELYRRECQAQRLAQTVTVRLDLARHPVEVAGAEYVPGHVVLTRTPGSRLPVRLVDLGGSVLLRFEPAAGTRLPRTLPPGSDGLRVPVRLGSAHRCDPHARGNSSQTFLLGVYLRAGRRPPQRVIAVPSAPEQVRLLALIDRDCR
jgi:hypothetical protein